ncbi:hypothetical protein BGZ94_001205 [Podila epigama]|nr:hypothetical protein BGZ94_001205 [Podila epigama]
MSSNGRDLHPHVNRTFKNSDRTHAPAAKSSASASTTDKTADNHHGTNSCHCGKKEWDLHPACIRMIENEGSAADVRSLHKLEHQCDRK